VSARRRPPGDYPPTEHLLRDLGLWTEAFADPPRAGLEVVPALCDGAGALAMGPLAVLVDVLAGGSALAAAEGGWIATSDLQLSLLGSGGPGDAVAESRVLRAGRSSVVLEVSVARAGAPVALATVAFARLATEGAFQRGAIAAAPAGARHRFSDTGAQLDEPFERALGFEWQRDRAVLPVRAYVGNSLGAIQGGVVAAFCAFAAERAVAGTGAARASDLGVHFLALGRQGPMEARPRIVRQRGGNATVRVELVDRGAGDRLCAVATAQIPLPAPLPGEGATSAR